ncbi:MAG: DUF5615 family PIN-like protein [Phycisphaerales bacterium]|nr:DUF5615 family PIN-like protein [Phycisphaerales bacterium]
MHFLADMGVSQSVVRWLRSRGHDAVHLRDEGLHRLANGEIFAKALIEHRVILTFDLDFAEIIALSGLEVASCVIFRTSNARSPFLIDRLSAVMPLVEAPLQNGAIVVIEDARHRVRRLPLGG